ncbi:acyl-CoA N-acyltransferase [Glomus cerebriforme]|uniref:Glucosamine 6-phosphate N-acetyltransferase n=1 Tax=Glomus cerebriforme TaxID=658196 RepID=A0A397SZE0_9GLOM|nr:acyl-CoA N-acyltransferase [Glomus cerebriforme]
MSTLFSIDYISSEVQESLPKGYVLRPLSNDDYERGFFNVLSKRFNYMKARNDEYFIIVIVSPEDCIIGTGTIFIERKFIFNAGLVGHIEDVAIDKNHQGKHFGLSIIQALKYIGVKTGCVKAILDCSVKNIPFYEKCGFRSRCHENTWIVKPI